MVLQKPSLRSATYHNAFHPIKIALIITPEFQSDLDIRLEMLLDLSEASERCVSIRVLPRGRMVCAKLRRYSRVH